MSVTITPSTGGTIIPDLVLGYSASTTSRNVVHEILGRPDPDVSLEDDTLRAGDLELFFLNRSDAWAAHTMHAAAARFTLVDTDVPQTGMTYVRDGGMTIELDRATRLRWLLTVGFREVLA